MGEFCLGPELVSEYLTSAEEEELVTFLSRVVQIGHGRTHREVIAIVEKILSSRGSTRTVTPGWCTSFTRRHPNLTLCTAVTLSLARATVSDRDILGNYFHELESTLEVNELLDKPCQIFNMDENRHAPVPETFEDCHMERSQEPLSSF